MLVQYHQGCCQMSGTSAAAALVLPARHCRDHCGWAVFSAPIITVTAAALMQASLQCLAEQALLLWGICVSSVHETLPVAPKLALESDLH